MENLDRDGDGVPDYLQPEPVHRAASVASGPAGITLTWTNTMPGWSYRLEATASFDDPEPWEMVTNRNAGGASLLFEVDGASRARVFRLIEEVPSM
jgi:hypothetical protein